MMVMALLLALAAHPTAPMSGHVAPIRGLRMYYETGGAGPPLLLLHGGAGNGMQFEKQIPAFAPSHRLIVPDCRAQGRTTDRPGPLTYHDMAEDMIALLDRLHVRAVDVMGWSDGGDIDSAAGPPAVLAGAAANLASPKSSTFTVPSDVILMFAGFKSRWMMPFSCAASSASAI